MRRSFFCKALAALLATAALFFAVRFVTEKTVPAYPEALGNTLDVEKITGT